MTKYERIKKLCKDRGVTITGVERELGFAKGSLSKIDKNKPSFERLEKLANYFEMPIEYFMNDVQTSGQEQSYYLDDETKEIVELMRHNQDYQTILSASKKLSQEDLKIARAFIERMSQ